MYSLSFPTSILFGEGAVKELPDYLKMQGLTKPLIVTDSTVRELTFFKSIIQSLHHQHITTKVYADIHKNPLKSDVEGGKEAYLNSCDSIIGLGGGAAMDTARAIALSINHQGDLFNYDDLEGGSENITEPVPPFITVPTTSGTGSEVGRAAIISEDQSKRKRILFHPSLMAQQVFADPELTYDLPREVTAATGMDALTHNMEAYIANGNQPLCDGIALEAIKMIGKSLPVAVKLPDKESRHNMMMGSLMGAVAFQKGLGIVHSLSHPLSTLMDMHHGLANAINLPYGMEFNRLARPDKFREMAHALNVKRAEKLKAALLELNMTLGLPTQLTEVGVSREHIPALVDLALTDFCLPSNPRPANRDQINDLYLESLE